MNLYPLAGMPKQRQLWGWISYDIANQSFTLIINTLLFAIFFGKIVVQDDSLDDRIWALTFGTSMLLTAVSSAGEHRDGGVALYPVQLFLLTVRELFGLLPSVCVLP